MEIYRSLSLMLLVYVCAVYGQATTVQPSDQSSRIEGPDSFVTDGTRELTLTYQTNVTVSGSYVCIVPGPRTCPEQVDNTCTFRPTLEDDGKSVNCSIQTSSFDVLSQASYKIHISHPPPSSPNITLASHTTQPLKQGDVITCSVSGGKPRVTSVTFHCQNPDLADQEDDVSDDGSTVSSKITVDTSTATEQNMTCTCSAFWEPEPGLYQHTTDMAFSIEYKAKVSNFSVNGTQRLTVNDTDSATVVFACHGVGRPSPVLRLYKQGNSTAIAEKDNSTDIEQPMLTLNVRYTEMGNYNCEADNGFLDPDLKSVRLVVNCAPERLNSNQMKSDPPVVTSNGHTFALVAYPKPDVQAIYFLGNRTKSLPPTSADQEDFRTECKVDKALEYLVLCSVTPHRIPESRLGYYNLSVSNDLGTLDLTFRVTSTVSDSDDDGLLKTVIIAASVAGAVFAAAIFVVVVIICRRRHSKGHAESTVRSKTEENGSKARKASKFKSQPLPASSSRNEHPNHTNDAQTSFSQSNLLHSDYATVGDQRLPMTLRSSTDASGYASIADNTIAIPGHHDNRAGKADEMMELSPYASTDCNMQEARGISSTRGEPTSEREPDMSTRPEDSNPGSNASRASMERVTGPKGDEYAVVSPKLKRANQQASDAV